VIQLGFSVSRKIRIKLCIDFGILVVAGMQLYVIFSNVMANLTPDQKKSRIDLIYLVANNVRHTIEKLSTRTTTLL